MKSLFEPCQIGKIELKNRVVMAPMTRSRALEDGRPSPMMTEYYKQRASAGLIVVEGAYPSEDGKGYCRTAGIINDQQVEAWKEVVDAVHAEGGKAVLQIMHVGRCSHADNKKSDAETVAPSAITTEGEVFTETGMKPFSEPRELRTEEIPEIVEQYRQATVNAFKAGFDGVELHGASGYLPEQFISPGSNKRTDRYGGSLENRLRFINEVLEAMCSVAGADRVGVRICPGFQFNPVHDPNPQETTEQLLKDINKLGLAYLHLIRASSIDVVGMANEFFDGPIMVNEMFDRDSAEALLSEGKADAIAFGRPFISNPDLVRRMQDNLPMNEVDLNTIYAPTEEGLVDYPYYAD